MYMVMYGYVYDYCIPYISHVASMIPLPLTKLNFTFFSKRKNNKQTKKKQQH